MDLKDRLKNIGKTKIISSSSFNVPININYTNIFVEDDFLKNLIKNLLEKGKNIVFVGNKSFDKTIIANYFQHVLTDEKSVIINSVNENVIKINYKIKILPKISIIDFVKILELIIYGYNSFVLGLDINSPDKVIEKIKAIIAINYRNLSDRNIETLLTVTDVVFVFVEKNEDGLFYIPKIQEVEQKCEDISLNTIYETKNLEDVEINEKSEQDEQIANVNPVEEENVEIEIKEENSKQVDEQDTFAKEEDLNEDENLNSKEHSKINKYKLLKDKVKSKHIENE
jgi:hypothetical protein